MNSSVSVAPTIALALVLAAPADAGGTAGSFQLLGQTGLTPTDASRDGRVVVGYNLSQFWYWTPEQGITLVGGITPSSGGAGSAGVSDDGTRMGFTVINPNTGKTEGAFCDIPSGQVTRIGDDLGALLGAWGPCSAS
jgi:hypothetical protein